MNNNQSANNRKDVVVHKSVSISSGPLPPPEVLARFDEIVPGAADRLIKMAEEQFAHRKQLEKTVIDSDVSRSRWGQILGFIIAIAGLIVSAVVSIWGSAVAGGVIGVGTLASLVGVFMHGAKIRKEERQEKRHED